MSISAVSGIGSYTATSGTSSQSEISKLRAQEKQLQQELTELDTDSSGQDSNQIQEQKALLQQQISQIQQQIQQLQNEANKKVQETQMTDAAQAGNRIGDSVTSLSDHLLDITV
ncbi:FlxA-like family protein [Clostridium sp. KNHs216]|uniref:FlxA-like family protein n=1 Tax=Eubacteriales TaxID=186802 RepID=UPI00114F2C91|nr:FlxA-like family protein [Clostridium sp. KNHs216]TQI65616.1 FlxA-like protein [Clostridium sp. KNHs216]